MNRLAALVFALSATVASASDYEARGRAALDAGDAEAAVDVFEAAVKAEPGNAGYHYLLGAALARSIDDASVFRKPGIARGMRKAWERAVEIDPDHAQARVSLFQFYLQAPGIAGGSREKADAQLRELARIAADREDDVDLWLMLGLLHQQVEAWPDAAVAFEHVVERDASKLMAWYQLGRTALRSGERTDRGIEALAHYLTQQPGENDPSHAWAHTRLGQLYAAAGRKDDARRHYDAALALEPDHAEAKQALGAL